MASAKFPQTLTYWVNEGLDVRNQPTFNGPFTSPCRWEKEDRLFLTENGRDVRSDSKVYVPDDIFSQGDYVVQGVSQNSQPDNSAQEVKETFVVPNFRGTRIEYSFII